MMKKIPLTRGQFAIVDDIDYERLSAYKWHAREAPRTWYAGRSINKPGLPRRSVLMHREVLGAAKGVGVDHINHNGLDNRRSNLRLATQKDNSRNQRKGKRASSCFKGVYVMKGAKRNRYRACIRDGAQRPDGTYSLRSLGCFESEGDAARAYDEAAAQSFGEFAALNFPEKPSAG